MSVKAVGNPPPEADDIKAVLEARLPEIIASFTKVLKEQYSVSGVSVGGFTVVPDADLTSVTCDQEGCSIN
ncbi:MAG: hypothetical protein AAF289_08670 [Cyanobacteria bacterium P01_A01_bin.135]